MWKQFVKDYLSFTKKERRAVLVLVALVLLVFILPWCWPPAQDDLLSPKETAEWIRRIDQLKNTGTAGIHEDSTAATADEYHPEKTDRPSKNILFDFDPNTLSADGWKRLGLRDRTILTIQKYLAKGGRFRKPSDLEKLYGLTPAEAGKLIPYVQIKDERQDEAHRVGRSADSGVRRYASYKPAFVGDINTADTAAFIALPGIGGKLAARIIHFREKLGGFYSVDQVAETFGLADSTFRKIKPLLTCIKSPIRQLDINGADAATLRQHPYIGWQLANLIVQYRMQHGTFKSYDDLLKMDALTPETFNKLKPYIEIK